MKLFLWCIGFTVVGIVLELVGIVTGASFLVAIGALLLIGGLVGSYIRIESSGRSSSSRKN